MASTNNTALKELNIKMFELMEDVKKSIDTQNGTETFFYPFRGNDYRGSRSINDGFFFPGQEFPYVVLRYNKGKGIYHIHITKDNNDNYSSYIGFYKDAKDKKIVDFASYNFNVDRQKTYIVKDEDWGTFKQKMINFFSIYRDLFNLESHQGDYNKNIDTITSIVSQNTTYNNLPKSNLTPINGTVNKPLNQILYGPPGTGKTYNTVNKALEIILGETAYSDLVNRAEQQSNHEDKRKVFTDEFKRLQDAGQIVFTTFHQSMSYEDFVEGIKPITNANGQLTYKVLPGIFKQICDEAQKASQCTNSRNSDKPNVETDKIVKPTYNYVLIIDEINRGNVSQIFGELITLIEEDKRLGKPEVITVKLPYSSTNLDCTKIGYQKEVFGVPQNLYIIGTMNTADRSVEALDTALRRRFAFEEMMPRYDATGMDRVICSNKLCDILWTVNQRIEVLKGREQQIGHSYLMKCKDDKDLKNAFKDKIVPLLQEYFYGDYSQIGLVLGGEFVKTTKSSDIIFPKEFESPNLNEVYHLLTDDEWENMKMDEALQKMRIHPWPNPVAENTNLAGNPQIEQEETKTDVSQEGTSENLS